MNPYALPAVIHKGDSAILIGRPYLLYDLSGNIRVVPPTIGAYEYNP
jgi:hypothetical protein